LQDIAQETKFCYSFALLIVNLLRESHKNKMSLKMDSANAIRRVNGRLIGRSC